MLASRRAFRAPAFGACALLLTAAGASAAITYSGFQNIPIPTNYAGVYLDFTDATDASVFTMPSESAVAGSAGTGVSAPVGTGGEPPPSWDVNFFFAGIGMAYSPDFQPFIDDDPTPTNQSQLLSVAYGTTIDAASASGQILGVPGDYVNNPYGGSGRPSGTTFGESHFDDPDTSNTDYSAFTVGEPSYLAFVADIDGTTVYGWMRVQLQNTETPGKIIDWAWSDTSIDAIPEPGAALLIVLGAAAFLRRQRS